MKKVINFVKGKREDRKDRTVSSNICVEITNPLGQKVPSEDEHIVGLQSGYGYEVDFSGKDKSMTKLHKAAWQGNLEKVKIHLKKIDINAVDEYNRTPLHLAAAQGHTNVVCFLLNNKAISDISDSDGMTPFLKAVDCGVKECVGLMVDSGVNISCVDNNGNTALHITARQGFFNIMSLLLKHGANCNSANNAGEMALHIATEQEHRDLVELLLQAGAQVNVVDAENRTPLMLAARVGQSSIVSLLLKYGASLDACDNNGWTAEDYSMIGGHEQLSLELKIPGSSSGPSTIVVVEDREVHSADHNTTETVENPSEVPMTEPVEIQDEVDPEDDCGESQTVKSPTYVRRRSLMALGTLESHRNSFVENGNGNGNTNINGNSMGDDLDTFDHSFIPPAVKIMDMEDGMDDIRVESDADWDSDDSLPLDRSLPPPPDFPDSSLESFLPLPELVLTPDPSLPPHIPELIITPDRRSRITLERTPSLDLTDSDIMISPDGTLGRDGTMKCSDEIWETANIPSPVEKSSTHLTITNAAVHDTGQTDVLDNTKEENANVMDNLTVITDLKFVNKSQKETKRFVRESQSLDNLDDCGSKYSEIESSQSCDKLDSEQFSGVYSLETEESTNDVFTQSLDSLEEESPVGTVVKRNVFHESHSLELLDEAKKPTHHHSRNKSVSVSSYNWSKSVDVLSKPAKSDVTCLDARSIDEQLQCYDEALRELAEEQKIKEELLNKVLEGRHYAKSNLNPSLSCDMLEPKRGAISKTGLSLTQKEQSRSLRLNKSSVKISSLSNATGENHHHMKKSNTVDVLSLKYCTLEKSLDGGVNYDVENYPKNRCQRKPDHPSLEAGCDSRPENKLPPKSQKYLENKKPSKPRSNSTCSRNKIYSHENRHKFYNSLELPPRCKRGKGSRDESNNGIMDWKRTLTVSSMPERPNQGKNYPDSAQSSKTLSENTKKTDASPKRPMRVKKLRKELSDTTYTKKSDSHESKRKAVGRSISLYMERMKYEEPTKKVNSDGKERLLCEKSESDSDWSERSLHHKRKKFGAMRDAIVDSEDSDEDPPFWVSTGKEGGFSRQDTVIHNQHASANSGMKKDSDEEKGEREGNEDASTSSDSGSASISQSDATPSHSYILKSHHSMLKDHLKQTTEEKTKLEETAAKLKEQNDRIQYDLADANQSIVVRDDKIVILQDELSRLSSKYSTTLDELNMLKQRLTNAEIELKHLRDVTRINIEKEHKPDPSTQQLIRQLHETNKAKKRIEFEKETLIAQHIMDIKKLQQDTIHWKNLYEEALSKLEQIEALCDPCLMENNQHIDKIKAAFKKFRDEKNSGRLKTKNTSTTNQNCIESKEKTLELEDSLDTNKETYCIEDTIIDNQVATLQLQLQQEKSRSSALENQVQKMLLDLQKKLDLEAELENLNRRLEKEFVPRVELEQLRANQETAIARIRQQALLDSETKLNAKLTEINQILQLQLQEQSQKERQREIVESQMKQEFENTRQKLLLELSKVQAALKAKESEERVLREQCEAMTREAEKTQELKRRQLIEKSYSVNLADPSTTREKELTVKRSVVPPPPPPPPLSPPPLDLALLDANSLRQQLERSISKHRDIHTRGVNDDRSRSPPGRSHQ
ncbi:putative leucine-rich repeat-containing protein DDB_G0290503 [Macrosteles quadrilineatus]|uniref:putative leucine-rich repeat-containing protein DDB_G0290503 n=1 Tax=Macrosteles quadrilineatus TaxID=74068 RepID=UPI0023E2D5A7|nr:putative leucine-rich repeat-containing protein DDB_G0290503 [Macrosteles quadrilineatus]